MWRNRKRGSAVVAKGELVRIRTSIHTPYSRHWGKVIAIDPNDLNGMYLVRFADGLQFRYYPNEIMTASEPSLYSSNLLNSLRKMAVSLKNS
jgi:hypothetical protein